MRSVDYSPWTDSPQLQTIGTWLRQDNLFSDGSERVCVRFVRNGAGLRNAWLTRPASTGRTCQGSNGVCGIYLWSNLPRSRMLLAFHFGNSFPDCLRLRHRYRLSSPSCSSHTKYESILTVPAFLSAFKASV